MEPAQVRGEFADYYYDQLTEFNGGKPQMVKGYTTDNYTDWAIEFINGKGRADKQKPGISGSATAPCTDHLRRLTVTRAITRTPSRHA